jgi:hypothetical protein
LDRPTLMHGRSFWDFKSPQFETCIVFVHIFLSGSKTRIFRCNRKLLPNIVFMKMISRFIRLFSVRHHSTVFRADGDYKKSNDVTGRMEVQTLMREPTYNIIRQHGQVG